MQCGAFRHRFARSRYSKKRLYVILLGRLVELLLERSVPLGTSIKINLFILTTGGKKTQAAFDAMIADYAAPAMDGPAPIEAADAATVLMHGVRITISRDGDGGDA